jgi:outer membrane protein assembly factor BamE (lipoprotein component of BamABCDE complex)
VPSFRVVASTLILLLAGCSWLAPPPQVRGNRVDADQLKELVPGTSTRADVTALIGSPTAYGTFNNNVWLYISEVTQPEIGATQNVLTQHVTELTFNDQGVLQNVRTLGPDNAVQVAMTPRTTPSPGTEANFFQQLFGNIGRFNAGGPSAITGGGPTGGAPRPY